jgi:ABC-2 type transport system permease protein
MKFSTVVYLELFKIFRKPRTYIAFGAIAAIVGLIQLGFYADGKIICNLECNHLQIPSTSMGTS